MIKKEDFKFFTEDGSMIVAMDALTKVNFPHLRIPAYTPVEITKIAHYKDANDFTVIANVHKDRFTQEPSSREVFHISDLNVVLPHHVNMLLNDYLSKKKDY